MGLVEQLLPHCVPATVAQGNKNETLQEVKMLICTVTASNAYNLIPLTKRIHHVMPIRICCEQRTQMV